MRSGDFGLIPGISKKFNKNFHLSLFQKICLCRRFEKNTAEAFNNKKLPLSPLGTQVPIYLSLGNEAITAALSLVFPRVAGIFPQHRCHDVYICWGGEIRALRDELLGLPTGCAKGMGGSASIHCPEINMFGHDGHVGSQVPIAVGYALGSGKTTLAIMGDAGAEEGYVLGAMGEAITKKLPVLFICYDNDLSLLTKTEVRRSWSMVDEAKAKGIPAIDITNDPWLVAYYAKTLSEHLPAFLNIRTCRELWHAGAGCDGPPEWSRFDLIKKEMETLELGKECEEIENSSNDFIDSVWQERKV